MKQQKLTSLNEAIIQSSTELIELHQKAEKMRFWESVKKQISLGANGEERQQKLAALVQVRHLPDYLEMLIQETISSEACWQDYVDHLSLKVKSQHRLQGQQFKQALLLILKRLIKHYQRWLKSPTEEVVDDQVFQGLGVLSLESQLMLEAQRIDHIAPLFANKYES